MSVQKSFTFYTGTRSTVSWTVTDGSDNFVNNASVTLTLYWGRDKIRPDTVPGVPVPNANSIAMTVNNTSNTYSSQFTLSSADAPDGGDYTLVIDAAVSNAPYGHWERPAVVVDTGI